MLALADWIGRRNLTIITLHRVVTEEERTRSVNKPMMLTIAQFEQLLDAVQQFGHPVTLGDAVGRLASGEKLEPGAIALTFDDGYRDVRTRAYPMLRSRGIPATSFLTTSVLDGEDNYLWWDEVDYFASICADRVRQLELPSSDDLSTVIECIEQLAKARTESAEASLRAALHRLSVSDRLDLAKAMRLVTRRCGTRPRLMLSWDEVRSMTDLIEPANHTVDHPMLDQLGQSEIFWQIATARARIEEQTGMNCRGFAYPSGAFTDEVTATAAKCGVEYAVTTRFRNVAFYENRFSLGRKDAGYLFVGGAIDSNYFRVGLSCLSDWLRRETG